MAESAPLLVEPHRSDEFGSQNNLSTEQNHSSPIVKILKAINLVASGLSLALLIANHIVITHVPVGSYTWYALDATRTLAIWMLVSLILSAINVAANIHNLINIIVDVVLASGVIPAVFRLIDSLPGSDWCKRYNYPRYPGPPDEVPVDPKCVEWKSVVQALMVAGSVFGGVVGAIYFVLLVLRIIAVIKSKFWQRFSSSSFRLVPGEITFSISLKFSRPEGQSSAGVGHGEEVASTSGRGPVYL